MQRPLGAPRGAEIDPERLRQGRVTAELTQEDLAKLVGVTKGSVSQWEAGLTRPRAPVFGRLCLALGVEPDALLRESDPKAEATA